MHRNRTVSAVALGGVLAALALVIMCLGTLIPGATFVCPMIACVLCAVVRARCGNRTAWAWYGCVAVLGMLLAPDREAAAVFSLLGSYPVCKAFFDKLPASLVWKLLFFNAAVWLLYGLLGALLGLEPAEPVGTVLGAVTLVLGNAVFLLLDRLLYILFGTKRPQNGFLFRKDNN